MRFEAGIIHENGPMVAVLSKGGIDIRCHTSNYTHSVTVGRYEQADTESVAKAARTVDRLARDVGQVRKAYSIL